jgi:hypothetical protein
VDGKDVFARSGVPETSKEMAPKDGFVFLFGPSQKVKTQTVQPEIAHKKLKSLPSTYVVEISTVYFYVNYGNWGNKQIFPCKVT